jgi:hypothetical protein
MFTKRSIFVLLCFFYTVLAFAEPHKVVDFRNKSDADGVVREISFCGRPSPDTLKKLPGHAFVAFSSIEPSGKREYLAIGHTTKAPPINALLTYIGIINSVPGFLAEEKYTASKEECLVVGVNKDKFNKAISLAKSPLDNFFPNLNDRPPLLLSYKLGDADCMSFMISVARLFEPDGLNIPPRAATELPLIYIRRFIDSN